MTSITVTTEKELKRAVEQKYQEIIIIGELAEKVKKIEKVKKLSKTAIATLTAACAALVASNVAAKIAPAPIRVPVNAMNVMVDKFAMEASKEGGKIIITTPELIIIATLGVTIVISLFKEYDTIEVSNSRLVLKKNGM